MRSGAGRGGDLAHRSITVARCVPGFMQQETAREVVQPGRCKNARDVDN
ncbi:MAG: hypothetical protein H0V33_12185 [Acidimicrobiia bacterium]|nr:hypothetical protein [Acidimicrobiia bacterium]